MAIIETETRKINYQSDFDFILTVKAKNAQGELVDVGFPTYNFSGALRTSGVRKFEFPCINGIFVNCYNDDNRIHVVANGHGLGRGNVRIDFFADIPNNIYPDGEKLTVCNCHTNIELTSGCCDEIPEMVIELIAPYIKGEKGDKGDALTWDTMDEADKTALKSEVAAEVKDSLPQYEQTDDENEYNDIF